MFNNMPASRGVNSTFSPAGRAPNADSGGGSNVAPSNFRRLGGEGRKDVGQNLRTSLQLPRPSGPVMGPGRSYPRAVSGGGGQGGFARLGMYRGA